MLLNLLQDEFLIDCYYAAIELNLDADFVKILKDEIQMRSLEVKNHLVKLQSRLA